MAPRTSYRLLATAGLLVAAGLACPESSAQFGPTGTPIGTMTTPPIVGRMPDILDSKKAKTGERLQPKKWRERYNVYEFMVLLWQLYHAENEQRQWIEIFERSTSALRDDDAQHGAYYEGFEEPGDIVEGYAVVAEIYERFRDIIATGRELREHVADPAYWPDYDEGLRITAIATEIKERAVNTLRYIPLVAGVEPADETGFAEAGVTAADPFKFVGSPVDRIQHLDRMLDELRGLSRDLRALEGVVVGLRHERARSKREADLIHAFFSLE